MPFPVPFFLPRPESEAAFLFQLLDESIVDQVFGFQRADFFIAGSEEPDRRTNSIHVGKDAPLVQIREQVVTAERVLCARQTQSLGQALKHQLFVVGLQDEVFTKRFIPSEPASKKWFSSTGL